MDKEKEFLKKYRDENQNRFFFADKIHFGKATNSTMLCGTRAQYGVSKTDRPVTCTRCIKTMEKLNKRIS